MGRSKLQSIAAIYVGIFIGLFVIALALAIVVCLYKLMGWLGLIVITAIILFLVSMAILDDE